MHEYMQFTLPCVKSLQLINKSISILAHHVNKDNKLPFMVSRSLIISYFPFTSTFCWYLPRLSFYTSNSLHNLDLN